MNDDYLPNMHPAITRGQRPLTPNAGGAGPQHAPGGVVPKGLGSEGTPSIAPEDLRQSDPYYLDLGAPRPSWEAGLTTFNRAVRRRFEAPISPAELLSRTNPTNSRVMKAPPPPRSALAPTAQEAIGRLRIGYDARVREVPGSRYKTIEGKSEAYWSHLVKKAEEANRLEELQKARRLRLRAVNHERVAAIAEVAPQVAEELPPEYLPGQPRKEGWLPPWWFMMGIVGVTAAMFLIPATRMKR